MTCPSLAIPLQSGELYRALIMLRYAIFFQQIWKEHGHSMEKSCNQNQAIWLA